MVTERFCKLADAGGNAVSCISARLCNAKLRAEFCFHRETPLTDKEPSQTSRKQRPCDAADVLRTFTTHVYSVRVCITCTILYVQPGIDLSMASSSAVG